MSDIQLPYEKIAGKTYSLFAGNDSTDLYYNTIHELALELIEEYSDINKCLELIRSESSRSLLNKIFNKEYYKLPFNAAYNYKVSSKLKPFTINVQSHLDSISLKNQFDSSLSATEFQYHLFMLEIELTNMKNRSLFLLKEKKIALLPHCLRLNISKCKATTDGFDMVCRSCLKKCYINKISAILKQNSIIPYIWMEADIKKLKLSNGELPGIIGIACIPELTYGLRKCEKLGITAIGVPLNANRCRRWMGNFYPNSVDLNKLDELLTKNET